jgi:3-methylcrotonyl-CoA carboxylase alpha subunit
VAAAFERAPVRLDDAVRPGDAISPYYDSMIGKLIVHGADRAQALARLDEALSQLHIVGLATNVQFLREVLASRSFARADLDTALITREKEQLFHRERLGAPTAVAAAIALTLLEEQAQQTPDPFGRRDHWRAWGYPQRRFEFLFHDEALKAGLDCQRAGQFTLEVAGQSGSLEFSAVAGEPAAIDLAYAGRRERLWVDRLGEEVFVFGARGATRITEVDLLAHAGDSHTEGGRLTAPMPGKIVSFAVKAGDSVRKGQALAVLEAMKMEHTIAAPLDGKVAEIMFAAGDQVTEGAELLKLEA